MSSSGSPAAPATTVLGLPLTKIIDVIGTLSEAFVPGASLFGFTVTQLANIAKGLADQIPEAVALVDQVKAAAVPGAPPPTPEQWAAWNAAADDVHFAVQEAAARVIREGH